MASRCNMWQLNRWIACWLMALSLLLTGCAQGWIYQETVEPLTTNLNSTPVMVKGAKGDVKHFEYRVTIEWDSNAISDIARKAGFKKIYYADLRTLNVLKMLGFWQQRTVHVYGE